MKVAVIGAGASGLIATKQCLDFGLQPTCFEKQNYIGGLWRYHEDSSDQRPSVYNSTVINTSKEFMAFSDFPPPAHFPNYMHNSLLIQYFESYARHFHLHPHMRLNTSVRHLAPIGDSGRWFIEYEEGAESKTEEFDAVLVCTGHHCLPYRPDLPGLTSFVGSVTHSHDYKKPLPYVDRRVLVIGMGNSAIDAAVELSKLASQVFLSTRRGAWIFPRGGEDGLPADISGLKAIVRLFPPSSANERLKQLCSRRFDHELYGLKPDFGPVQSHPAVNDDLPTALLAGRVSVKPDIREISSDHVTFIDGSSEQVDDIILATGYRFTFPFLSEDLLTIRDNQLPLYDFVFPTWDLPRPTLAFVGFVQPIGAINPISELQARWALSVFTGKTSLPSKEQMVREVQKTQQEMQNRYYKTPRHTIQVDYVPYTTKIARHAGCAPREWSRLLTEPRLGFALLFGPYVPYRFRIDGPHQWAGAKEALLTCWDRVIYPLNPKYEKENKPSFTGKLFIFGALVGALSLAMVKLQIGERLIPRF